MRHLSSLLPWPGSSTPLHPKLLCQLSPLFFGQFQPRAISHEKFGPLDCLQWWGGGFLVMGIPWSSYRPSWEDRVHTSLLAKGWCEGHFPHEFFLALARCDGEFGTQTGGRFPYCDGSLWLTCQCRFFFLAPFTQRPLHLCMHLELAAPCSVTAVKVQRTFSSPLSPWVVVFIAFREKLLNA